jgi:beta-glucosidase
MNQAQDLRSSRNHKGSVGYLVIAALSLMTGCSGGSNPGPDTGTNGTPANDPKSWPAPAWPLPADAALEARVKDLLAHMTLEEKVGQVIQGDISTVKPDDLRQYHLGSVLAGGGSAPGNDEFAPPEKWLALADAYYAASVDKTGGRIGIPVIWGIDAMHGHSNIVGTTLFPHNIGLGAAHNPELIGRIAAATAEQVRTTGIDWTFAPTLTVPQDDRWGRTYEGYSEDPAVVASYAGVFVRGLQGEPGKPGFTSASHVISSVKHFIADGGTENGKDQGDAKISEQVLRDVHGAGYKPAIEAGVQTIMASYSSWNGVKNHGNRYLLTDVLKGRMNFGGFVVGDWNAHGQIPGCKVDNCAAAINAGLDMYMAPDSWKGLYQNLLAQAKDGTVPMARLDDAVSRILRVKMRAGLFEAGPPSKRPLAGEFARLWSDDARALARDAVRQSLVLLKNENALLPLNPRSHVLVTGDGADNIGKQNGGWTITWQGTGLTNAQFPHGTSIWSGVRTAVTAAGGTAELSTNGSFRSKPDVAIVVFGEDPYAEMLGDRKVLALPITQSAHLAIIAKLREQGIPVVSVLLSGRPLWVNRELNASRAFIAAWLPGTEGGGIADLLFRAKDGSAPYDFTGTLSYSWPRNAAGAPLNAGQPGYDPLFALGYGLSYKRGGSVAPLPEDPGASAELINAGFFLEAGNVVAPWQLVQEGGAALRTEAVSDGVQQIGQRFVASGSGPVRIALRGSQALDAAREANGDVLLLIRLQANAKVPDDFTLAMGCGTACGGKVRVGDQLAKLARGSWQTIGVPLKCFQKAGVDMSRVSEPLVLESAAAFDVTLARAQLGTNPPVTLVCP